MHNQNVPHGNDPRQRQWVEQMLRDNPAPNWGGGKGVRMRDIDVDVTGGSRWWTALGCLMFVGVGVVVVASLAIGAVALLGAATAGDGPDGRWAGPYTCADGVDRTLVLDLRAREGDDGVDTISATASYRGPGGEDQGSTPLSGTLDGKDLRLARDGGAGGDLPHAVPDAFGVLDVEAGRIDIFVGGEVCSAANLTRVR